MFRKETILSDLIVGTTLLVISGTIGYITVIQDISAQVQANSEEITKREAKVDQVPLILHRLDQNTKELHTLHKQVEKIRELQTEILIEIRSQR